MKIFIPRPVTRYVSKEVYESISNQKNIDLEVIEVVSKIDFNESIENRVVNRNKILDMALSCNDEYFVMLDSDSSFIGNTDIAEMFNFLLKNPDVGAVSLASKNIRLLYGHVDIECTMIKTDSVKNVRFKNTGSCECNMFWYDLKKNGYEHRYLDNKIRLKTVEEYRNGAS